MNAAFARFLGLEPGRHVPGAAGPAASFREEAGEVIVRLPLIPLEGEAAPAGEADLRLRAYGSSILRLTFSRAPAAPPPDSPMLAWAPGLSPQALRAQRRGETTEIVDAAGRVRARFSPQPRPERPWSQLLPAPQQLLHASFFPAGGTEVPLTGHDAFFPGEHTALGLSVGRGKGGAWERVGFSFQAEANERFAGTGERFAKLDLAGRTLALANADALGVNNQRAYKNVPFFASSRPYGLFVHTSGRLRLSLGEVSTRAAQGALDEDLLDLFLIGGGNFEEILRGYRQITGFPPEPPAWSYGTWMSRMTYFSAAEVEEVARRLRAEKFPCDVLHLDTGWFARDWICEWTFSEERFPDPAGFMRRLRERGFRVSLWQNPNLGEGNRLLPEAREKGYVPAPRQAAVAVGPASDLSAQAAAVQIDFTNPAAIAWYQGLLQRLFALGAAVIKADFGESVNPAADFLGMTAEKLHNLYALLYQRAAAEATRVATGEGLIWARAGWAGCQRYPVHWGGDSASSWEGMAASLRGGLHLGLSGFAHWSHDVPGFHGLPDFMNSRPSELLYLRWTQFGVLSSHLRYHGTSPREPWEFPAVAPLVREWLKLRYALIPYLRREAAAAARSGFPLLRALPFHDHEDPACWAADDQYLLGSALLVAPVMSAAGRRDVYLPRGRWVDFWTGEVLEGPRRLLGLESPPGRLPLYAAAGASLPVYPEPVACTREMKPEKTAALSFDASYRGLARSLLGALVDL